MGKCCFDYNKGCNEIATTTLIKGNGKIGQLCEEHYNYLVKIAKMIAEGNSDLSDLDDPEVKASHWLVKNKIPS